MLLAIDLCSMRCHFWHNANLTSPIIIKPALSSINLHKGFMDITLIYAIGLGGVLLMPILFRLLQHRVFLTPNIFQHTLRYLDYPYLIQRHRILGPWTWLDVIFQSVYITSNCVCLGFRADIAVAGTRAGYLSIINMMPLFLGAHLNFLADIFGITLKRFRSLHHCAGLMSFGLICFHILAVFITHTIPTLDSRADRSALVVSSSFFQCVFFLDI